MDEHIDLGSLEVDEKEEERGYEDIHDTRPKFPPELEFIRDIPMRVSVELSRTDMLVKDLLQLSPNIVLELDKLVGEPLEIFINDQLVARGEVVVINDKFGIRLTDIIGSLESTVVK